MADYSADWTAPYYETQCKHRVRSYQRVCCVHGPLTSTGYSELGRLYDGVRVAATPAEENRDV